MEHTFSFIEVVVTVEGIAPLLQNKYDVAAQSIVKNTKAAKKADVTPREVAEKAANKLDDGSLYIPTAAFARAIRDAGSQHKLTTSRKSVKAVVPAAILMLEEVALLHAPGNQKKQIKTFEVDSRRVVNPTTRGAMPCHRPRIEKWATTFHIRINTGILEPKMIHQLLTEAGMTLGVGDFRPERGGPFGMFRVTSWDERKYKLPFAV